MNIRDAKAEMVSVFLEVWKPTGFEVRYDDVATPAGSPSIPTGNNPWARVTIRHEDGGTTSLAGTTGKRRYNALGYIVVQLFAPSGSGHAVLYDLADSLLDAYVKLRPHNCVAYMRQRIKEVPSAGASAQVNFITDFSYETAR